MRLSKADNIIGLSYLDFDVQTAKLYRYKYRARNENGWGEFSDAGFLFASSTPSKPEAPTLSLVDSTQIRLQFYAPSLTGGSQITSYELFMDAGQINSVFSEVISYTNAGGFNASQLEHTLTVAQNGLITGQVYSFKFRATN